MINKEQKYLIDYFIYKKKFHWFIFPAIVVYYNKDEFFETGVTSPAFCLSLRWLIFFAGVQIQKNTYYGK